MNLNHAARQYGFLTGSGTLGALIAEHDWSDSPLGPLQDWPPSLRNTLSLMLNSPQPMWLAWGQQAILLYNDALISTLTAFSSERHPWALGQPAAQVWVEIWSTCQPMLKRVWNQGEAIGADPDEQQQLLHSFHYSPIRDETGAIGGCLCIGSGQPAMRQSPVVVDEDALTLALQSAANANRTKDEFLAMLGHELRNPLTPILTAVHLMRLRGSGNDKECEVIERQARHLLRLVDDLLDVSRVVQGKIGLQRQSLEIAEIISKAVDTASPLLEQRQHHLHLNVAPQGLQVHADPARLTQVIANVLTNACQYTAPHGDIAIDAYLEQQQVVIEVRDNGCGIQRSVLPHVFDMFVQESQALDRAGGGLGLGLAIVRSLTELHGGSVHAYSAGSGRGTLLTIRLPAHDAAAVPECCLPAEKLMATVPAACNVLVVDDNQDAAQMMAELLSLQGHPVRVAFDGPAALAMVTHFTPRIVMLDIGLPIMDGYEVARQLRAMPHLQGVSLIAVTGYGQPGDKLRSAQAGFDHHLVKPVDIDRVAALIRTTLTAPVPAIQQHQ